MRRVRKKERKSLYPRGEEKKELVILSVNEQLRAYYVPGTALRYQLM